jgi:hypothetical protein
MIKSESIEIKVRERAAYKALRMKKRVVSSQNAHQTCDNGHRHHHDESE